MGSSAVCSGVVVEKNGKAVIRAAVSYEVPVVLALLLSAGMLIGSAAYYFSDNNYMAVVFLGLSVACLVGYQFLLWEARFLRSKLSECLGGVEWERTKAGGP